MRAWLCCLIAAAGCQSAIEDLDGVFYDGDGRRIHCAMNLDTEKGHSLASIDGALDRAAERGEVVELYAHAPGETVEVAVIEHVLEGAARRGLAFVTYRDFADGGGLGPGIALALQDDRVATWTVMQPRLRDRGARITLFVSRYTDGLDDAARAALHDLAADGHAIEPHGALHVRAPSYVEEHGLAAYLADEVLPSIDALRADGYRTTTFAYPLGARTAETDAAILEHLPLLRTVSFSYSGVDSPCPQ